MPNHFQSAPSQQLPSPSPSIPLKSHHFTSREMETWNSWLLASVRRHTESFCPRLLVSYSAREPLISHLMLAKFLRGQKSRVRIPVTFQWSLHITPVLSRSARKTRPRGTLNATQVAGQALSSCCPVCSTDKRWPHAFSRSTYHSAQVTTFRVSLTPLCPLLPYIHLPMKSRQGVSSLSSPSSSPLSHTMHSLVVSQSVWTPIFALHLLCSPWP